MHLALLRGRLDDEELLLLLHNGEFRLDWSIDIVLTEESNGFENSPSSSCSADNGFVPKRHLLKDGRGLLP
jgi:hypothetical protein